MATTSIKDLKKYLQTLNVTDLTTEIVDLFQQIPQVKQYYRFKLTASSGQNNQLQVFLQESRQEIRKVLDPNTARGNPSFGKVRKILASCKLAQCSATDQIELMLVAVEEGFRAVDKGYLPESFYDGIYHMYESACKAVVKAGLQTQYKARFEKTIYHCDVGYGLCEMTKVFDGYFP